MLLASFTLIADDGPDSPFSALRFIPAINNQGTVAYQGDLRSGGQAVFTRDPANQVRLIATTSGLVSSFTSPSTINDAGTVAFLANLSAGGQGIFSGSGLELTRIADTNPATSPFSSLPGGPATITNDGTVAFRATRIAGGEGVFTGAGGAPGTVLVSGTAHPGGGVYFGFGNSPLINNQGTVGLFIVLAGGFDGVYTVSGGEATLVAAMTGPFSRVSPPAGLNETGAVAFQVTLQGGGQAIVTGREGDLTFVATTGGAFSSLGGPAGTGLALNNAGGVVFFANLAKGGSGIFKGPDPNADKIIAVGDPLFGSTVTSFPDSNVRLNDAGQVVFLANLADGRRVMVLADTLSCTVSLVPNDSSPGLVGNPVRWTATPCNCGQTPAYQFSVGPSGGPYRVVRDFSPADHFTWVPMGEENYEVRVAVKDGFAAASAEVAAAPYRIFPRVTGPDALVSATSRPLVALYSVPASSAATVFVQFSEVGNKPSWRSTNTLAVEPGKSTNLLVAGMLPDTTYQMRHVFGDGKVSSPLLFRTGRLPSNVALPDFSVLQGPGPGSDLSQDLVLHSTIANDINLQLVATDLAGRIKWYLDPSPNGSGLATLVAGGSVLSLVVRPEDAKLGFFVTGLLQEVDLAGNLLRETNWEAVNAQLAAMGRSTIRGFHHDVQRLPDGKTVLLTTIERTVDISGTPTLYVGDGVVVLDEDFQVVWSWDVFDHLDVNRGPILTGSPGEASFDWTHSNSVAWSPADGNLVISVRHQDWVIKIDYRDGAGDGHVVWRLGFEGNFTIDSPDPRPWFSHQHDARYIDDTTLVLFDNANTRRLVDPGANSRGQVLVLNEKTLEATLVLNADLGTYSAAVGSAQRLPNGNYYFTSGFLGSFNAPFSQGVEVLPDGSLTYMLQAAAWNYRSYRLSGLYGQTDSLDQVPLASTAGPADVSPAVTFRAGIAVQGMGMLTASTGSIGTHAIAGRDNGDRIFAGSTSALLNQTANPPVIGTADEYFITLVYLDLLKRPVDPAGSLAWTGTPDRGASRAAAAPTIKDRHKPLGEEDHYQLDLPRTGEAEGESAGVSCIELDLCPFPSRER